MALNHGYQHLRGDEDHDDEKSKALGVDWSDSTQIIPTHKRSFIVYMSIFLISLTTNVLLILDNARLNASCRDWGRSKYTGITFDKQIPFHAITEYWNPNLTREESDAAWDAIDTNPMAVSLHHDYAKEVGLEPSTPFPWDTDRSIYYIKGIHDLHCIKLLHKAISPLPNNPNNTNTNTNTNTTIPRRHLYHCLDSLRQSTLCAADDTPMPALTAHRVGDSQLRQCRDWSKLIEWATRPDQNACAKFDDYREVRRPLEIFGSCPEGSPYSDVAKAYFELHGRKGAYWGEGEGEEE